MSRMLRWTPQQLQAHLLRRLSSAPIEPDPVMVPAQAETWSQTLHENGHNLKPWARVSASDLNTLTMPVSAAPSLAQSRFSALTSRATEQVIDGPALQKPRRIAQRARAIASMDAATWSGSYTPGRHLELVLHGVVLLSVNTLYALTHFERVAYRRRWHALVERCVLDLVGPAQARRAFEHFIVRAHRVSRRLADTDAQSGYLKYPIDSLRYSGILVEDTQAHFRDLLCSQAVGSPLLALNIESVEPGYVPVAQRDAWQPGIQARL